MGIEVLNQAERPEQINLLFVVESVKTPSRDLGLLRNRSPEWGVTFTSSSRKALEYIHKNKIDIVFCDVNLQDAKGVVLLRQIKELFPYILRILFTDNDNPELSYMNLNAAHQYLSKNSPVEAIINTGCRTLYLNRYLPNKELKNVLNNVDTLPCLPKVYQSIMQEISSPNASISRISEIIEGDPVMSAKIIQLMNSSYFSQFNHVKSLSQAVTILGVDTIQCLVLNTQVLREIDQQTFPINIQSLINHSLGTGNLAKQIAEVESLDRNKCNHAMMAGMLHDIGKVLMANYFPERYRMVDELLQESDLTINEAEKHLFSTTHAEVGAYLLGLWGVPEMVVEAVAFHHYPWLNTDRNFNPTTAVYIADVLLSNQESDEKTPLEGLDEKFIKNHNLAKRIPVWQEMKRQINL